MILFVLSGIPGSGKTILSRELAEKHKAVVCSYDDMPNANTRASMDGSVMRAWFDTIHDTLKSGKSVVCDGLNLTVEERKKLLSLAENMECRKVLYAFSVPVEICKERNRQRRSRLPDFVLDSFTRKLEVPTMDEGWDEIVHVKE